MSTLTEEESRTVAAIEKALTVLEENGIRLHSYTVLVGAVRRLEAAQGVYGEIAKERAAQDAKWGVQRHPDGTGDAFYKGAADAIRFACDQAAEKGEVTWRHILQEETFEAFAESDPAKLRAELVQCAAVAVCWVQALDARGQE